MVGFGNAIGIQCDVLENPVTFCFEQDFRCNTYELNTSYRGINKKPGRVTYTNGMEAVKMDKRLLKEYIISNLRFQEKGKCRNQY